MKVGTKSILFGAHQFLIHPWFVAAAWSKLYGFPWDPRLWVAFFVHDLGYWGKPNMDGPEGERHVLFGARVMGWLFDRRGHTTVHRFAHVPSRDWPDAAPSTWYLFTLLHSRFIAMRLRIPFSRLCVADKLAIALTPAWLYLPLARATGEIKEYMKLAEARTAAGEPKYASMQVSTSAERRWFEDVREYLRRWVEVHKDGCSDKWTPDMRKAKTASGVWQ